jgi:hypothetical protein
MLAPITHITCIAMRISPPTSAIPQGENVPSVEMMNISTNTSHMPRVKRNRPSSRGVFLDAISPALVPARSTNTGAQKWVIQRVPNIAAVTLGSVVGSWSAPEKKKSLT